MAGRTAVKGGRCPTCGKKRYPTRKAAKLTITMITAFKEDYDGLEVYFAHGWYHLRNKQKARERRK